MTRDQVIQIRVSRQEKAKFERLAREAALTVSELTRLRVFQIPLAGHVDEIQEPEPPATDGAAESQAFSSPAQLAAARRKRS